MRVIILIICLELYTIKIFAQDISKLIEYATGTVVQIITQSSTGSGVIINLNGFVLTNFHVIEDYYYLASTIQIITNSNDR